MRLSSSKSTKQSLESIYQGTAGLNKHRLSLLKRVPESGDYARLKIGSVSKRDLAYLSASEKHEFALWRSRTDEILCHGTSRHCDLPEDIYNELLSGKYEIIAHTHVDRGTLLPSIDDRMLLKTLGQRNSVIISVTGEEKVFGIDFFDEL